MVRGQTNPVPCIKKEEKFNIHNRFDIEVIDSITGEVKQNAFAENIVLNALWDRLLAPNTYFNFIHYGTGTGTLAATRTSLFTFLGAKTVSASPSYGEKTLTYDFVAGWVSSRKKIQIAPEEHVGSEFKEVGIGWSATASNLVTHALLKDMNGNPITIVKTNTDVINIYATVFVHFNPAGYNGVKINPSSYNEFVSIFLVGDMLIGQTPIPRMIVSPGGRIVAYLDGVSSNVYKEFPITPTYILAEKKIRITKRLGVGDTNWPIRLIGLNAWSGTPIIDCEVGGTWFAGTSITGEALGSGDGSKKAFKTKNGFIKPGAKVYVDGVEQLSGVSIVEGIPPNNTNFGGMFDFISVESGGSSIASNLYIHPEMSSHFSPNNYVVRNTYFNPYAQYGLRSVKHSGSHIYMSEDGVDWVQISSQTNYPPLVKTIPVEHRTKPYIRLVAVSGYNGQFLEWTADTLPEFDVNFTTAPATGAVVTIDYVTESIAKDTDHVFDFSMDIILGEKTD